MASKPFLDKICANAHIPNLYNKDEYNSVKLIPNLSHTGIKSAFERKPPAATNPEGRITALYKHQTRRRMETIYRDHFELAGRESVFRQGHKQFLDLVLQDMESTRLNKSKRRMRHWTSSKARLGFPDSFSQQLIPLDGAGFSPKSNHGDDGGDYERDDDFEALEPEDAKPTAPTTADSADGLGRVKFILKETESGDRARPTQAPPSGAPISSSPKESGEGNRPGPQRPRPQLTSQGSLSSNISFTSSSRKMRPHSRMSLFKELLETVPPPRSPTRRYGRVDSFSRLDDA